MLLVDFLLTTFFAPTIVPALKTLGLLHCSRNLVEFIRCILARLHTFRCAKTFSPINRAILVDASAPSILVRSRKSPAVFTGLRVVDVLFPVAKGQRELVIGDRQSGKSTI